MTKPRSKHISKLGLNCYQANSWSVDNGDDKTGRYPGKFHMREEVEAMVAEMDAQAEKVRQRHAFELRRAAAIEAFLMKELGYEP